MTTKPPVKDMRMECSDFKGNTVAVTGSSGFVGRPLVKKLCDIGCTVIEMDIASGIDLTDFNHIKNLPNLDCLIHLAGKTFVPDSYENPGEFFRTNIVSAINALELCRLHKAKMILASSYVYGVPKYIPIDELHPLSAFNPYASTKLLIERLCKDYHKHFGVKIVILRPFNIYGPHQDQRFLLPLIIEQAAKGAITLKDPAPKRDFVYIDDVINAYVSALSYDKSAFEIFNIASGTSFSVFEICEFVKDIYKTPIQIHFTGEKRTSEVSDIKGDYTKAKELLNWIPQFDILTGLKEVINSSYFNAEHNKLSFI